MILAHSRRVFICIDLSERSHDFTLQGPKGHRKCLWPREDDIIMASPRRKRFDQPQSFLQTAADEVALDRPAELFGNGEPKPWR